MLGRIARITNQFLKFNILTFKLFFDHKRLLNQFFLIYTKRKVTYYMGKTKDVTTETTSEVHGTIFDDVFRTIAQKMPYLLIPLINEVFQTNYPEDIHFQQFLASQLSLQALSQVQYQHFLWLQLQLLSFLQALSCQLKSSSQQ